jgi:integrase
VPASSKTELSSLIDGYCLCAQSDAKSPKTIEMVTSSVRYLEKFLYSQELSTDVADIGAREIRRNQDVSRLPATSEPDFAGYWARVSELTSLRLEDIRLAEGVLKVSGKGRKERLFPIGKATQRLLWNYIILRKVRSKYHNITTP